MTPPEPQTPPEGDTSRAASLWPATTRADAAESSSFAATRFDPLAEERAQLDAEAAAAFDVCHPALALRAVLLVQAVSALVALADRKSVV